MQKAMVFAFFLNLILNPLFIFGLPNFWGGFGFDGIALSTIISNYYVMFYMLLSVFNSKVVPLILNWTFDKAMFRELLRQMLPPSCQAITLL